jgi:polysaccharide biosynthesis protein PelD
MLKVEEMAFLDLNPASVQNFRVLCDWIGAAFANAQRFEEMQANPYFDPVRRLMPAPLFDLHRPMMAGLAQRLGFDLSALYVGIDLPEPAEASARIAAARVVARLADQLLRPTDLRFDWRREGWDVAILLPGADPAAAATLARRFAADLSDEIAAAGLQAGIRHTTEALHRSRGPRLLLPSPVE